MQTRKIIGEARQLKRRNAEVRRQSHVYKWIAIIAASDCLLVFFYDHDMRNVVFSFLMAAVCSYLALRDRNRARGYRREYDRKFGPNRAE